MRALFFLVSLSLSLPASAADAPPPDKLIAAALDAQHIQDQKGWKYIYREDEDQYQFGKKGDRLDPVRKTYEIIMLEGDNYRKLVLIDGRPLPDKVQKQVDKDLEQTRTERKKGGLFTFSRSVSLGGLDELQRLFDNKVTGEDTVGGRKTWVIESQPKPGLKPADKKEEEAMSSLRATWIDQEEGVVVKERFTFMRATNSFQPGTQWERELVKVGGAWLTDTINWKGEMKPMAVIRARFETHSRFYEYKRFQAESKVTPQ